MRISIKHPVLIMFALLLTVPLACLGQEPGPASASPKILPSIVVLNIQRSDGGTATAAAFAGIKDGVLVTALHIIKGAVRVTATFPNGEEFDCAGIIDKDERRNVALIRIKAFGRPMLKINPVELAVGDKLSLPIIKDGAFGVFETSVAEVQINGGVKFYRLTGEFPGGNSGSPIIDSRGEVAGIHVTIVQNNKDVEMALPSAYILGLEPSLPVQPWTPTASQQAPAGPAAPGPNASVDATLASTLINAYNYWSSLRSLSLRIYRITRYSNLDGYDLYKVQTELDNQISQLGWLKTEDPLRQKLIQITAQLIVKEKQALENDMHCAALNKGKSPSKAMPEAEESSKRALALLNSIPGQIQPHQQGFRQLAQSSPEFLKALPTEMRYFLGVDARKSKLDLGAYLSANNPFLMLDLPQNSLGDKLNLNPGDTIVSAGSRTFKAEDDLEDFMLMVEANPGGTLGVIINRGGKMKSLSMKIPSDLLQRYLRTP